MKNKNYIFYDENYLAPGYLIVNVEESKVKRFLKIYNESTYGTPLFGIRAYLIDSHDDLDKEYNAIEFSFKEDDELYNCFSGLCDNLKGEKVFSTNVSHHGKNHFKLENENGIIKMIVEKDVLGGTQHPTSYIDISIGDEYSCKFYNEILKFYLTLTKMETHELSSYDVEKMLLMK